MSQSAVQEAITITQACLSQHQRNLNDIYDDTHDIRQHLILILRSLSDDDAPLNAGLIHVLDDIESVIARLKKEVS